MSEKNRPDHIHDPAFPDDGERPRDNASGDHTSGDGAQPQHDAQLSKESRLAEEVHPVDETRPSTESEPEPQEPLAAENFDSFHPSDAAEQLEEMPLGQQLALMESIQPEDAAHVVSEMDEHQRAELIGKLDPELAADILEQMYPDDAADVLHDLQDDQRDSIVARLRKEDKHEIWRLYRYDPDSAGGVMNSDNLVLDPMLTADQAINLIRREMHEDIEIPYYAYLVDENDALVGVLSLRDILVSRPGKMLKNMLPDQQIISVQFDTDKEEVANLLRRYNFLAVPVVDYENRFLGVVTHDDVIDIIHDEASEDMLGMVGAGQDETVDTPWRKSVGKRLPWLFVNIANSVIAASVVLFFEGSIAQMAILAALMPIIANQGGNSGQQSLAVVIRQLAVDSLDRRKSLSAVLRELRIGLVNGLCVSVIVLAACAVITDNISLAIVMALALFLNMTLGSMAGASIPLILKRLGRDPAQASSIFLTTLTDMCGFFIFLGMATVFLLS